jgi:phosphoglycolate phosphatase
MGVGTAVKAPVIALFDIDETLVHTGGAGARSWTYAFQRLYGIPADIGRHSSIGETDPVVVRKTFQAVLNRDPDRDEMGRLFAQYQLHLSEDIRRSPGYRVLDGVEQTLMSLVDAGVTLGIVSGAMEGAARTKLTRGNLNRFFVFGGYGSDSSNRAALTQVALDKAALLHSDLLEPDETFVIGDTPHDIEAAKAVGAVAVAVASGKNSEDQLLAAGADHVLPSLTAPFPGLKPPIG